MKAPGFGGGKFQVALPDFFVKIERFLFHTVEFLPCSAVQAAEGLPGVHVEKEGHVRKVGAGGEGVDRGHVLAQEAPGHALIDGRGIQKTVGNDHPVRKQRWQDHLPDKLRAAGGEKQKLGLRHHGQPLLRMLQKVADLLADGGAARLAHEDRLAACRPQAFDQPADLRAFAAALRPFEGDEETCLTRHFLKTSILKPSRMEKSAKICFVHTEADERKFFREALPGMSLDFVERLAEVPAGTEVVSVFISERLEEGFLSQHPGLRLVATRSTGCDHIDLEACRAHGVRVANVYDYGENSVAEHTFALILALSRRLRESEKAVSSGRYTREELSGFDLCGKILGVVGTGRIGRHVIRIGRGFGMRILASDIAPDPEISELGDFEYVPLDRLFAESHVITLHVPLNKDTWHMVNADRLARCQEGILLINTARGGLMDTDAVIQALESGRLGGVGLDVLEDERVFHGGAASVLREEIVARLHATGPRTEPCFDGEHLAELKKLVMHSRLLHRDDVVFTPHIAYNSIEARERISEVTLRNIREFLAENPRI